MSKPLDKYSGKGIGDSDYKNRVKYNSQSQQVFEEFQSYIAKSIPLIKHKGYKLPEILVTPTPAEISEFFSWSKRESLPMDASSKERANYFLMGEFVSALIQKSYSAGFNNFYLDKIELENQKMRHLPCSIRGVKKNPIKIHIFGDLEDNCAINMRYVELTVDGLRGDGFSSNCENCVFDIKRISKSHHNSQQRSPYLRGLNPETNRKKGPKNCKFVVHNDDDFDFLFYRLNVGNKVVLESLDNKIEKETTIRRRCDDGLDEELE